MTVLGRVCVCCIESSLLFYRYLILSYICCLILLSLTADNNSVVPMSKEQMPRITKKIAFVEYGGIVKIKEKSNEEHYMTRYPSLLLIR